MDLKEKCFDLLQRSDFLTLATSVSGNPSVANVYFANDGFEAIEKLTEHTYDIVLMDIQMPKMDGLEATRVIRNELGLFDLPIIGLSANAHDDDVKKAVASGMDNYITKPIEANTLFKTLWHHLAHQNK